MPRINKQIDTDELTAIEVYKLVLDGTLLRFPPNFWTKNNAIKIAIYLIEDILKWSKEDIKNKFSINILKKYKLGGMAQILFNCSMYQVIDTIYPNEYKPWELAMSPNKLWNKETGILATKWLIEEKLQWSDDDIKKKLCIQTFKDNSIGGMLSILYKGSPFIAINEAYPNKFKEWQLARVPVNYWTKENGIKAVKWMIQDYLKWSEQYLLDNVGKIDTALFDACGLSSMLTRAFNASSALAITSAYPNIKMWMCKQVPNNYWKIETGIEATKWLIEEKLKLSKENDLNKIKYRTFSNNGLTAMLKICFGGSYKEALKASYPGLI